MEGSGASSGLAAKEDHRVVDSYATVVMRKLVVEAGWAVSVRHEGKSATRPQRSSEKGNTEQKNFEDWKLRRGGTSHLLSGSSNGRKSRLSLRRWKSEKHRCWRIPVEGFWKHIATDCLFCREFQAVGVRVGGQLCSFNHEDETGPLHGM